MRGRKRAVYFEEPSPNLTPLIDVVFVILIMFIVIAPLIDSDHVELAQAKEIPDQRKTLEPSALTLHVYADNTIAFNKHKLSIEHVKKALISAKQHHPQAKVHLFHDKKAQFGTYQAIKQAVEEAGFTEMDVILKP